MKVSHAVKLLKNLPTDWFVMWGDTRNVLHGINSVRFNYKENFAEIVLFNDDGCTAYNKDVYTHELIDKLSEMPQDADLLFRSFGETNYVLYFDLGCDLIKVKGFRRAKYTEYDFNISQNRKHHYVRMMLFNDDLDKRS